MKLVRMSPGHGDVLLAEGDPRQRLTSILEERDPLYRMVADMVVKTDRRTARHVVREIQRRLSEL